MQDKTIYPTIPNIPSTIKLPNRYPQLPKLPEIKAVPKPPSLIYSNQVLYSQNKKQQDPKDYSKFLNGVRDYNDPLELNSFADALFNRRAKEERYGGFANVLHHVPILGDAITAAVAQTDLWLQTGSQIVTGKGKEALLNTLTNVTESLDILANPVKSLITPLVNQDIADDPKYNLSAGERLVSAFGFGEDGRYNYDYDTGNMVGDIALEIVSDPTVFIGIAKGLIGGGLKVAGVSGAKNLVPDIAQEAFESVVEVGGKKFAVQAGEAAANTVKKQMIKATLNLRKVGVKLSQTAKRASKAIRFKNAADSKLLRAGIENLDTALRSSKWIIDDVVKGAVEELSTLLEEIIKRNPVSKAQRKVLVETTGLLNQFKKTASLTVGDILNDPRLALTTVFNRKSIKRGIDTAINAYDLPIPNRKKMIRNIKNGLPSGIESFDEQLIQAMQMLMDDPKNIKRFTGLATNPEMIEAIKNIPLTEYLHNVNAFVSDSKTFKILRGLDQLTEATQAVDKAIFKAAFMGTPVGFSFWLGNKGFQKMFRNVGSRVQKAAIKKLQSIQEFFNNKAVSTKIFNFDTQVEVTTRQLGKIKLMANAGNTTVMWQKEIGRSILDENMRWLKGLGDPKTYVGGKPTNLLTNKKALAENIRRANPEFFESLIGDIKNKKEITKLLNQIPDDEVIARYFQEYNRIIAIVSDGKPSTRWTVEMYEEFTGANEHVRANAQRLLDDLREASGIPDMSNSSPQVIKEHTAAPSSAPHEVAMKNVKYALVRNNPLQLGLPDITSKFKRRSDIPDSVFRIFFEPYKDVEQVKTSLRNIIPEEYLPDSELQKLSIAFARGYQLLDVIEDSKLKLEVVKERIKVLPPEIRSNLSHPETMNLIIEQYNLEQEIYDLYISAQNCFQQFHRPMRRILDTNKTDIRIFEGAADLRKYIKRMTESGILNPQFGDRIIRLKKETKFIEQKYSQQEMTRQIISNPAVQEFMRNLRPGAELYNQISNFRIFIDTYQKQIDMFVDYYNSLISKLGSSLSKIGMSKGDIYIQITSKFEQIMDAVDELFNRFKYQLNRIEDMVNLPASIDNYVEFIGMIEQAEFLPDVIKQTFIDILHGTETVKASEILHDFDRFFGSFVRRMNLQLYSRTYEHRFTLEYFLVQLIKDKPELESIVGPMLTQNHTALQDAKATMFLFEHFFLEDLLKGENAWRYKDKTFVSFDIESTGLSAKFDSIIEIGASVKGGDEFVDSHAKFTYETLNDDVKQLIDKRGGMDSLNQDGSEFKLLTSFVQKIIDLHKNNPNGIILVGFNSKGYDYNTIIERMVYYANSLDDAFVSQRNTLINMKDQFEAIVQGNHIDVLDLLKEREGIPSAVKYYRDLKRMLYAYTARQATLGQTLVQVFKDNMISDFKDASIQLAQFAEGLTDIVDELYNKLSEVTIKDTSRVMPENPIIPVDSNSTPFNLDDYDETPILESFDEAYPEEAFNFENEEGLPKDFNFGNPIPSSNTTDEVIPLPPVDPNAPDIKLYLNKDEKLTKLYDEVQELSNDLTNQFDEADKFIYQIEIALEEVRNFFSSLNAQVFTNHVDPETLQLKKIYLDTGAMKDGTDHIELYKQDGIKHLDDYSKANQIRVENPKALLKLKNDVWSFRTVQHDVVDGKIAETKRTVRLSAKKYPTAADAIKGIKSRYNVDYTPSWIGLNMTQRLTMVPVMIDGKVTLEFLPGMTSIAFKNYVDGDLISKFFDLSQGIDVSIDLAHTWHEFAIEIKGVLNKIKNPRLIKTYTEQLEQFYEIFYNAVRSNKFRLKFPTYTEEYLSFLHHLKKDMNIYQKWAIMYYTFDKLSKSYPMEIDGVYHWLYQNIVLEIHNLKIPEGAKKLTSKQMHFNYMLDKAIQMVYPTEILLSDGSRFTSTYTVFRENLFTSIMTIRDYLFAGESYNNNTTPAQAYKEYTRQAEERAGIPDTRAVKEAIQQSKKESVTMLQKLSVELDKNQVFAPIVQRHAVMGEALVTFFDDTYDAIKEMEHNPRDVNVFLGMQKTLTNHLANLTLQQILVKGLDEKILHSMVYYKAHGVMWIPIGRYLSEPLLGDNIDLKPEILKFLDKYGDNYEDEFIAVMKDGDNIIIYAKNYQTNMISNAVEEIPIEDINRQEAIDLVFPSWIVDYLDKDELSKLDKPKKLTLEYMDRILNLSNVAKQGELIKEASTFGIRITPAMLVARKYREQISKLRSSITNAFRFLYELAIDFDDNASVFMGGYDVLDKDNFIKMIEKLPKEIQNNILQGMPADTLLNGDNNRKHILNYSIFGIPMYRHVIDDFATSNPVSVLAQVQKQLIYNTSAMGQYAHLYFNSNWKLTELFRHATPNEILAVIIAGGDNYVISYMGIDKKGLPKVITIAVDSTETLAEAIEQGAVMLPYQTHVSVVKTVNSKRWSSSRINFLHKITYALKMSMLVLNPGFIFRNFIDSTLKNFMVTKDPSGMMSSYIDAMNLYMKYKEAINIILITGGDNPFNPRTLELLFNSGNAMPLDKKTFMLIHNFIENGPSAGSADILESFYLNKAIRSGKTERSMVQQFYNAVMAPTKQFEQITRLAEYWQLIKTGMTNTEAFRIVTSTHFDYAAKSGVTRLMELIIPFYSFQMKNFDFWVNQLVDNPAMMRVLSKYLKVSWDFQDIDFNRINEYQSRINHLTQANLLLNNQGLTLKINPSLMDPLQLLASPIDTMAGKVTPLLKPFMDTYGITPQYLAQQGSTAAGIAGGLIQNSGIAAGSLGLGAGVASAGGQVANRYMSGYRSYERTGSVMPLILPSIFGSVNLKGTQGRASYTNSRAYLDPRNKIPRRINIYSKLYTDTGANRFKMRMTPVDSQNLKYRIRDSFNTFRR